MKTPALPFARFGALAFLLLVALPAEAINVNPAVTNGVPRKRRPIGRDFQCDTCTERTLVTNGCVKFAVSFGRTPLAAGAPVGRVEIYEQTAARLPSGADVLRYDHPLMRRIVDEDAAAGLVAVEEGSGWIVVYRDGVPVGWSSGADLAIRKDPATGLWIEQLENRTLVYYDADNTVDHIVTPAGVRLDWENAGLDVVWDGNAIGQVRSVADGLMDVTKLSPSSFRVSWYPPAAVGERENGRYAATGNPAKTFTFSYSNVGGEHRYALREYRDQRFDFDYLWKSGDGLDWTFVKDPHGLAIADAESSTFAAGSTAAEGTRYETHVYSDAAGHTNRTILAYRYSANGATPVSQSAGSAPAHWSAARAETGPAAGRLVSVTNEWGGVTEKAYDTHGRLLSETTTVFGSLEEMASYTYETNLVDGFPDRRPRHVVVTRDGVVVSDTTYSYDLAIDGGRLDTVTRSDPVSGVSLVSSRLYYPAASTNAAEAGRIHLTVSEDRTATLYAYSPTANGGYVRTATHGYIAEPDASAPGADASRFAIAPAQSTRTVETVNFRGDVIRVDEFVHTGEQWSPAGWITYTYNLPHKRTGFADHKGDWEASEWICSGPVWQDLADGTAVTNTFDKAKRLSTSTHYTPFGAVTTAYSYDPLGQIVGTTISTNGVAVRGTIAAYDARGRSVLSVDEQGRTNTVTYSADNRIVTSTTQSGAITTTTYNTDGSVSTVSGNVRPYELRSYGVDSATGLSRTEVRTAQNETSPSVLSSRTFRNALGQTIRVERPAPNDFVRATLSTYNALGRLVSEQTEYRTLGTPQITYFSPLTSTYSYDALGSLAQTTQTSTSGVWRAQSSSSIFSLDPDGSVWSRDLSIASCSDPAIAALTNRTDRKLAPLSQAERSYVVSFDLRGNQTRFETSFDRKTALETSKQYDPGCVFPLLRMIVSDMVVQEVSHSSVTNLYEYDSLLQNTAIVDGRGNRMTYTFDPKGHLVRETDAAGNAIRYDMDKVGRVVREVDALGNETKFLYDESDRVVAKWGAVYPVRFQFDSYGRCVAMATRQQEPEGDLQQLFDWEDVPEGWNVTRWVFEESTGALLNKIDAQNHGPAYSFNAAGLISRRVWARGVSTEYEYDDWDQMLSRTYSDSTPDVCYSRNAFGWPTMITVGGIQTNTLVYDVAGTVTNELSGAFAISSRVDPFGRQSGYGAAFNGEPLIDVDYSYDENGLLSTVSTDFDLFRYTYLDGTEIVSSLHSTNGLARHWIWEPERDLLSSVSNGLGGATAVFEYENDVVERRISKTSSVNGSDQRLECYTYNSRSELASTTRWNAFPVLENDIPDYAQSFSYDAFGNAVFVDRSESPRICFSPNSLNQYAVVSNGTDELRCEYDLDGNMTFDGLNHYEWDGENRLVAVLDACANLLDRFEYDSTWRMSASSNENGKMSYAWANGKIVASIQDSVTARSFVWGLDLADSLDEVGGVGGLLALISRDTVLYPFYDGNGNIESYFGNDGSRAADFAYSPTGEMVLHSGPDNMRFPSFSTKVPFCEASLYYYGVRFYNPKLGRWMSRDPDPEEWSEELYQFCRNEWISSVDTFGLRCQNRRRFGPYTKKSFFRKLCKPSQKTCPAGYNRQASPVASNFIGAKEHRDRIPSVKWNDFNSMKVIIDCETGEKPVYPRHEIRPKGTASSDIKRAFSRANPDWVNGAKDHRPEGCGGGNWAISVRSRYLDPHVGWHYYVSGNFPPLSEQEQRFNVIKDNLVVCFKCICDDSCNQKNNENQSR